MNGDRGVWGLRVLALLLAMLAWFVFSGESREPENEKVIEAPVRYSRPEGMLLLERHEQVQVVVRGGVSRLRNLSPFLVDVFVELPPTPGRFPIPLGPEHVVLPEGLEVVSIEPNVVEVLIDEETTDIVEIAPVLEGEPAAGAVVREVRTIPNRAQVRGPASTLRSLSRIQTAPINLEGHALSFQEEVLVVPPAFSITVVEPRSVRVAVQLAIPEIPTEGATAGGDSP